MAMDENLLAQTWATECGIAAPTDFMKKFCAAFISHIRTNAEINGVCVGLTSAPGGGPVTGAAVLPPGSIT